MQRNVELHKSQRLAENEAHGLCIALKECKEGAEKLKEQVMALMSTNSSLADRLSTSEIDLDSACRESEDLMTQVAALKKEVRGL